MRLEDQRESENIEDRRGKKVGGVAAGGGLLTIIIVLVALYMGKDPSALLQQLPQQQSGSTQGEQTQQVDPAQEPQRKLVAVVLADTEDVWGEVFPRQFKQPYNVPKLVLFTGQVQSACGFASAATGPFYCPGDQKVYLDLAFFKELQDRFKAPGDFACAYVVAHEVGHHVQNLLGLSDKVHAARSKVSEAEYNALSVRLELQADFLAGVWASHAQRTRKILDPGDLDEAFRAANAIGDDTLQKQAQGYVVPDSFTHGTSAQRVKWFRKGFETGDVSRMNELFELPENQL